MLNVNIKRVRKTKFYYVTFEYNKELVSKIREIDFSDRKFNKKINSWELVCDDLYKIIYSYKGRKDIFFNFVSEAEKQIFIQEKDKIEAKKAQKIFEIEVEKNAEKEAKKYKDLNREIEIEEYQKYLSKEVKPFKFQCIGADFLVKTRKGMLAMEQGTGKTLTSILACEMEQNIKRILVVVPNSLKFNYKHEIEKFTGSKSFVVGDKKNDIEINEAKYIIVSYTYFRKGKGIFKNSFKTLILNLFNNNIPNTLILDESHNIKNSSANQTTNLLYTLKKIKPEFIFLLTGTPMPSRITELYTQLKLLRPNQINKKETFYSNYCGLHYSLEKNGYIEYDEPDLNKLFEKMDDIMFRVKKEEVLKDLPELLINEVYIDMTEEEEKIYNNIELGFSTINLNEISEVDVNENMHILAILTKLRQYTSKIKTKFLPEIIQRYNEENQKLLIFDEYKTSLNELYEKFKHNSRLFTGDITDLNLREQYKKDFQEDPNVLNMFLSVATGNAGHTLTESQNIFLITENYVPSMNQQLYSRAHRIGQKSTVNANILIVRGTIDEKVNQIVKEKSKVIEKVIDNQIYIDNNNKSVVHDLIKYYINKSKNKDA